MARPTLPRKGAGTVEDTPVVKRIVPSPRARMSGSTWPTAVTAASTCNSNCAAAEATVFCAAWVIDPVGLGP